MAAKVGRHVITSGIFGRLSKYSNAFTGAGVKNVELRSTTDIHAACGPCISESRAAVRSAINKLPTFPNTCAVTEWVVTTKKKRSEEHTSELQSLMPISYAVFSLK